MKQHWVLGTSGQPEGPYPEAVIRHGLKEGRWKPSSLVCEVGREEWVPLAAMPGMADMQRHQGGVAGDRPSIAGRSRVDRLAIGEWPMLPAQLIDRFLQWLKRSITESLLERIATFFERVGTIAIPFGMLAVALTMLTIAIRMEDFRFVGWLIPCLLVGCLLQFVAVRFSREADAAVLQTRNSYSRGSAFDAIGLLLLAAGSIVLFVQSRAIYEAVAFEDEWLETARMGAYAMSGLLMLATGGFFLNPASLGMSKVERTTIGQDGIAIIAAVAKGGLKAVRISFGIVSGIGAGFACCGAVAILVAGETIYGPLWFFGGVVLIVYGSLLPPLAYLVSMVIFIVIEFIEHGMGRDSRSARTDQGAPAAVSDAAGEPAPSMQPGSSTHESASPPTG